MKLSVKLQDQSQPHNHQKQPQNHPLLLRARIPISIFNLPFLSCFSTTTHHPSDLSLSLATHFPSGPTLKLSYSTTPTTPNTTNPTTLPLTLSLKSGIGVFGSPKNSPLVISADFSFSPTHQNPTFTLLLKPQLGSFSLRKSTNSDPKGLISKENGEGNSNTFGFVPLERPSSFKDFSSMEEYAKDSIFKGIAVMAKTEMPLTKRVMMDCRWGVNFPNDLGLKMPSLSVNKIGIRRVEEAEEVKQKKDEKLGETELLKGMCFWMNKELESLRVENREMKHRLEELIMTNAVRNGVGEGEFVGRNAVHVVENSGGFEQWRNKRNSGGENGKKEVKKNVSDENRASDVESELQKAIRAASSS